MRTPRPILRVSRKEEENNEIFPGFGRRMDQERYHSEWKGTDTTESRLFLDRWEVMMLMHDWTRVGSGTFHAFHTRWITHLSDAMNKGVLPPGYYSDPEQHLGRKIADVLTLHASDPSVTALRRTLTIRHTNGHRIVAMIEILSPGNKASEDEIKRFVRKAKEAPEQASTWRLSISCLPVHTTPKESTVRS